MLKTTKFNIQHYAQTKVEDMVVPEVYKEYVLDKSIEKSALIKSGVVTPTEMLNELAGGAGITFNVPMLNKLSGVSKPASDKTAIVPNKQSTFKQVGVRMLRDVAWSWSDLSVILSGADPLGKFYEFLVDWKVEDEQKAMLSILKGLFSETTGKEGALKKANHFIDISGGTGEASIINAKAIIKGKSKLGDNFSKLDTIAMHSYTFSELQLQNLIEYIPNARGEVEFPTYLTYKVIVDDTCPYDETTKTFITYILSAGAIGRGDNIPNGMKPIESDRDILEKSTTITYSTSLILHPDGLSWNNPVIENTTPSNEELEKGDAYTLIVEAKKVGIVAIKHKVSILD